MLTAEQNVKGIRTNMLSQFHICWFEVQVTSGLFVDKVPDRSLSF